MTKRASFPLPVQEDLIPPSVSDVLTEYQTTMTNLDCHLPEVAVRYFIYLVIGEAPKAEIQRFALMMRNELNEQRLMNFIRQNSLTTKTAKPFNPSQGLMPLTTN